MTSASENDTEFVGRRAIVTGGGRGIGRAVADRLAQLGAIVHVVSRSDGAEQAVKNIIRCGGSAVFHRGSVADESFIETVVTEVDRDGGTDILVNAAAVLGPTGPFDTLPMGSFADVISTNLLGTCNCMHQVLPGMKRRGFGRIINFAGGGAAYSYPHFAPYGVSKAAVVRLTETVADEIRCANVTVNVIAPGAVPTDMLAAVRRAGGEVRTVVDMEEPLRLVTFLAGQASSHVNGRFIHVRDRYEDPGLFEDADALKLRRVEKR